MLHIMSECVIFLTFFSFQNWSKWCYLEHLNRNLLDYVDKNDTKEENFGWSYYQREFFTTINSSEFKETSSIQLISNFRPKNRTSQNLRLQRFQRKFSHEIQNKCLRFPCHKLSWGNNAASFQFSLNGHSRPSEMLSRWFWKFLFFIGWQIDTSCFTQLFQEYIFKVFWI